MIDRNGVENSLGEGILILLIAVAVTIFVYFSVEWICEKMQERKERKEGEKKEREEREERQKKEREEREERQKREERQEKERKKQEREEIKPNEKIDMKKNDIKKIKTYYDDGALDKRYHVNSDGVLHGLYEEYNTNGSLYRRFNFKNGQKHGHCFQYGVCFREHMDDYFIRGKKVDDIAEWHKYVAKDRPNEKIEAYYDSGNIKNRFYTDENGKLHGLYEIWDREGTIRMRRNYKNGKLHGVCKEWDEGELQYTWYYINDKKVKKRVWNEFEKNKL